VKLFDSQAARGSVSIGLTADRKRNQIIGFDTFTELAIASEAVASVTGEQIQEMDRYLAYRMFRYPPEAATFRLVAY
jgi:hypothetical protein